MALNSDKPGRPTLDENQPQPQPSDLSEVIAEGRQRLAETPQVGVQTKRGRGRPRKDGSVSQPAPGQASPSSQQGVSGTGAGFSLPSMGPFFAEAIKMPFAVKASKTGFDGWKLTDAEAGPLGEQFDQIVKIYLPQLDQKHAVLASFAFSIATVIMTRTMEQATWEKARKAKPLQGTPAPASSPPPPPAQPPPQSSPVSENVSTRSLMDAIPLH